MVHPVLDMVDKMSGEEELEEEELGKDEGLGPRVELEVLVEAPAPSLLKAYLVVVKTIKTEQV